MHAIEYKKDDLVCLSRETRRIAVTFCSFFARFFIALPVITLLGVPLPPLSGAVPKVTFLLGSSRWTPAEPPGVLVFSADPDVPALGTLPLVLGDSTFVSNASSVVTLCNLRIKVNSESKQLTKSTSVNSPGVLIFSTDPHMPAWKMLVSMPGDSAFACNALEAGDLVQAALWPEQLGQTTNQPHKCSLRICHVGEHQTYSCSSSICMPRTHLLKSVKHYRWHDLYHSEHVFCILYYDCTCYAVEVVGPADHLAGYLLYQSGAPAWQSQLSSLQT